jgi:hypothetical protein
MNAEQLRSVLRSGIRVAISLGFGCAVLLGQSKLPKTILDLFPGNAVEPGGLWHNAGKMGMLTVSAHLTSSAPCIVDKAPGFIKIELKIYFDRSLINPIQGSAQEQMFSQDLRNLESNMNGIKTQTRLMRVGPMKTEDVTGGHIAYFDSLTDCSEYVHRERPAAKLIGIVKTEKIFGTIEIEGPMTADQIKAMAVATLGKIVKTDFAAASK